MQRALLSLLIMAAAASAETFSGTVVDVMCRGKDLASHTRDCAISCSRSGYGLVTAEGKFLKFDESGNARTLTALKKLSREQDLKAKITGTVNGDVLQVEAIDFEK